MGNVVCGATRRKARAERGCGKAPGDGDEDEDEDEEGPTHPRQATRFIAKPSPELGLWLPVCPRCTVTVGHGLGVRMGSPCFHPFIPW